jgi:hypothetical protein
MVGDWAPVAHICASSFSGGRDQKDHDLRTAQGKSKILSQKYPPPPHTHTHTQKELVEWLK